MSKLSLKAFSKKGGRFMLVLLAIALVIVMVLPMLERRRRLYRGGVEGFGCSTGACY